jgi:hypothetical protein
VTAAIVDRWWWQLSLALLQVAATIVGVYLAAALALRHERRQRLAQEASRAADALRPTLQRIARALSDSLTLESEEVIHAMDADHHVLVPPRLRIRQELQKAEEDYRSVAGSVTHHLAEPDLTVAIARCMSIADAVDTVLGALPQDPSILPSVSAAVEALHEYVVAVDAALFDSSLRQAFTLPPWSPRFESELGVIYDTWWD